MLSKRGFVHKNTRDEPNIFLEKVQSLADLHAWKNYRGEVATIFYGNIFPKAKVETKKKLAVIWAKKIFGRNKLCVSNISCKSFAI